MLAHASFHGGARRRGIRLAAKWMLAFASMTGERGGMKKLLLVPLLAAVLSGFAAAPLAAETVLTGDRIDGTPVIATLDAASLAAGQVHRFWFRPADTSLGQGWTVPVIVVRGTRPGPRLLITAGIHGDELNGIAVIHRLAAGIDPATLAGTLVMVPGLNTPGLLQDAREFATGAGRGFANLNRSMPGKSPGGTAELYAEALWTRLLRPNADAAVDLHTQSRGTAYVLYAFASTPRTRRMAELVQPDVIKLDKGEKGTVENELVPAGVPAITFELGAPGVFDAATVARAVAGLRNLMTEMAMLPGKVRAPAAPPFTGNDLVNVSSLRGGWATALAPLGSLVGKGQPLAVVRDPFGRVVDTVVAPRAGRIVSSFTDPRRDPGSLIARIVFWNDDAKCAEGC